MTTLKNSKVLNNLEGSIELALEDIAVEQTNDGHTIKLKPTGK
jgi:hypothetical protein